MDFAEELKAHRGKAAMSRDELAAKVNYSASLIAMIESGKRSPSRKLADLLDVVFDEPGTFARAEKRLRDVPFPASFRPFTVYEAEATALRWYEHALVPGLLQTEKYARAVLSTRPNTTEDEIDELLTARMARQEILSRDDPPLLYVLLDEGVLHRPVAPEEVMRAQFLQLGGDVAAAEHHRAGRALYGGRTLGPAGSVHRRGDGRFARYRVPGGCMRRPCDRRCRHDGSSYEEFRRLALRGPAARCIQRPDREGSGRVTMETAIWRTSSYSGNNGGACIEVADVPGAVLVRDTRDREGPVLAVEAWRRFATKVKTTA
jgi:transcriptional regulator with XRE-family HTH domain